MIERQAIDMKTYSYLLVNLGCANCAAKMERKLNNYSNVEEATINFMNKKLTITFSEDVNDIDEMQHMLQKTCSSIESGVVVTPLSNQINTKQESENGITESSSCHDDCCNPLSYMHEDSCDNHSHNHEEGCDTNSHNHEKHSHNHEKTNNGDYHKHKESTSSHSHSHNHDHSISEGSSSTGLLHNPELIRKLLYLLGGAAISYSSIILDIKNPYGFLLIIVGYLIIGHEVLIESFRNILHGQIFDENFLMVIATIGAFFVGEYPEAIAVMLLFQIGELLQDIAVDNSRKQLKSVMNLKADYANLQTKDGIKAVAPEEIEIGDVIIVKPSEKVPLDGEVIDGSSFVDTSSLTGESVPRSASKGDRVLSGSINGNGTLFIRVTSKYADSTVAKILDLVENASSRKSSTENFITKFAAIYTPAVVGVAFLLAVLPPILTGSYDFNSWIYKACGFLVVSCPCALVISIPLGFFGGIGCASKHGILVKGSNYLEALNSVETAVFDKTGTLTEGVFKVSKVHVADKNSLDSIGFNDFQITGSYTKEEYRLLLAAASVENYSTHPIAKSIVNACDISSINQNVSEYEEIAGHGIKALVEGNRILVGSSKLLDRFKISFLDAPADTLGSIVYVAINDIFAGYIIIADQVKKDAKKAIAELKSLNIQSVMLTGDIRTSAAIVGKELGIDQVFSELLPGDKVDQIENLIGNTSKNGKVLFSGDGMNDAPVLARADIGIAMGGVGSDAAIEAADIVIMTDEPSKIAGAIRIAKNTRKIVTQNIILSLGIKGLVMLLLAIGMGSLWLAVFADVGVAMLAILNSIRALKYQLPVSH